MNEICDKNLEALASLTVVFIEITGLDPTDEMIDAINENVATFVKEWYIENLGRWFDIENEEVDRQAINYAGRQLMYLKNSVAEMMKFNK